jgi:histidinol dehydrogenase
MIVNVRNWRRPQFKESEELVGNVREILRHIKKDGDQAIAEYAQTFDGQEPQTIKLMPFEDYMLAPELEQSIRLAARRIEHFALFQKALLKEQTFDDDYGRYAQRIHPIERVGAYIPGGRFPLISTALMTLIPARVAGCKVRIASSPSDHPALLAAASLAGATEFRLLGGVQAIGAYAYGFQGEDKVDLVVGPGNAWVNEAKNQCQSRLKIDGLAGPSELMALCDGDQPVEWLAADALAQAEHDPNACSILASDNREWLEKVLAHLKESDDGRELLDNEQIELVHADSLQQLIEFSETYAAEHLMLCHKDIEEDDLTNYGSLFVGANSAVALGDYISGPNHTLPTLGYARQTGGLNVTTYLRIMTVQTITDEGRKELSKAAMPLAEAEGLMHHHKSLKIRKD